MNINDISTQLLYTTVPIFAYKGGKQYSSGTGFIFSKTIKDSISIPLIITNYHVLKEADSGIVEFHEMVNDIPTEKVVRVSFDKSIIENNKLGNLDLIAIPIAQSLNELEKKDIAIYYKSINQDLIPKTDQINSLAAIETITFIGYPNMIYDNINKLPIVRQGITATPIWNDFMGENDFLIDAEVFPGSSGSPVFLYNQGSYPSGNGITIGNRLFFVGIISHTFKTKEKNYMGIGKVINSKALNVELNIFLQKLGFTNI